MYCEMQLLSLLDFSFTVSLFLVILIIFFKLLEKYLKIIHKTCWHIYTRPPIGFTPSECFISCEMCSDKLSLKLGMYGGVRLCYVKVGVVESCVTERYRGGGGS